MLPLLIRGLLSQRTPVRLLLLIGSQDLTADEYEYLTTLKKQLTAMLGGDFRLAVAEHAPAAIAKCDVLVRPTLADGDAVSIREALALGLGVVASDVVQRPPETWTYRVNDGDDLVRKVLLAIRRARCEAGRAEVGRDDAIAELEAVYCRLGAAKQGG
ncbi:MAG: hypothetical protein Kow0062_25750 [Acidobacteriota bacterium]